MAGTNLRPTRRRGVILLGLLACAVARGRLLDVNFTQNSSPGTGGPAAGPTMTGAALLGSPGDVWNGVGGAGGGGIPLVDASGRPSSVTLAFTAGGGYDAQDYGGGTPFAGTAWNNLMQNFLYNDGVPQTVTLAGLKPDACYELAMYNGADRAATNRTTWFTINGCTEDSTWDGATSRLVQGVDCVLFPLALSSHTGTLMLRYTGTGSLEGDLNGLQCQPAPVLAGAARAGTNILISFMTRHGFTYQVQTNPSLDPGGWSSLGLAVSGNDTVQTRRDGLESAGRFYRVQISTNAATMSLLHAAGTAIADAGGAAVQLAGLNLGGWLVMEPWMCPADSGGLPDTYSIISELDQRFGVAEEQALLRAYQTSWITTNDLDNLQQAGFNCVRVPVWWGNFYSLTNTTPAGWRSDAFAELDWVVTNCAARGIYTLIDLHGVVGGQSSSDDTGQQNQNTYWTNQTEQAQTTYLWTQIATHFRGNPAVAGYDLINEPIGTPGSAVLWNVYSNLYRAIRQVDPDRLLVLEGAYGSWNWSMLPDPAAYGWTNVAYSMHEYKFGGSVAQIEAGADSQVADFMQHQGWNVPGFIGEWNDMGQGAATYDYSIHDFAGAGLGWAMWACKATSGLLPNGWGWYDPVFWPPTPNVSTDSAATILSDWQQWQTIVSFGVNPAVGL